ncbi:MAG: hypothetical protein AAGB04_08615 [Pseudomonadota bacterium]
MIFRTASVLFICSVLFGFLFKLSSVAQVVTGVVHEPAPEEFELSLPNGEVLELEAVSGLALSQWVGHEVDLGGVEPVGRIDATDRVTFDEIQLNSVSKLAAPIDALGGANTGAGAELAQLFELAQSVDAFVALGVDRLEIDPTASQPDVEEMYRLRAEIGRSLLSIDELYESAWRDNDRLMMQLIATAYQTVQRDLDQTDAISSVEKSIYALDDSIPSFKVKTLNDQRASVVAIRHKRGFRPHCSGVLIADQIVLSSRHCLKWGGNLVEPDELSVIFGYEFEVSDDVQPASSVRLDVKGEMARKAGAGPTWNDIILLELTSSPDQAFFRGRAKACFDVEPVRRNDPIYAFGFSDGGRMMFHGNGRVFLPYEVDSLSYPSLRLRIHVHELTNQIHLIEPADILNLGTWTAIVKSGSIYNTVYKRMAQLDDLYTLGTDAEGASSYDEATRYLMSANKGRPAIAAAIDVSQSDSGAPVFTANSNDQCLIGIILSGAKPFRDLKVSIEKNERISPSQAILDDIVATYGENVRMQLDVR